MENNSVIELNKTLEEVLAEVERVWKLLQKKKTPQVRAIKEREIIRVTSKAWFERHKNKLPSTNIDIEWETLSQVDDFYKNLLEWSHKAISRARYLELLRSLKAGLIQLRSEILSSSYKNVVRKNIPDLEKLIPNSDMRQIIYRRWHETENCLEKAPLAATVMMGAILEALFLARINKLDDKSPLFKLKATPLDRTKKKPLNLSEWTLNHYISVAYEMGWIRRAAKDISSIMMEYRNLIHPEKQLRLGIILEPQDAIMFWGVFVQLSKQIILSTE